MQTPRSLLYYLRNDHPVTLKKIQERHVGATWLFDEGLFLGESEARGERDQDHRPYEPTQVSLEVEIPVATDDNLAALIDLVRTTADEVGDALAATMRKVKARMRLSRRVKFAGGAFAAAAGAVTAVVAGNPEVAGLNASMVTVVGAIFSSIGGLLSMSGDFWQRSPVGLKLSDPDDVMGIVETGSRVELVRRQSRRHPVIPMTRADGEEAIKILDEAAVILNRFRSLAT